MKERRIISTISRVRRKIQRERLLKGLAFLVVGFLMGSALSSYLLVQHNFSDEALFWTRIMGGLSLLALFFWYLFRPAYTPPSRRQVARFLEERHPHLEDRLSTAIEVSENPSRVPSVIRELIELDAWNKLLHIAQPRFYRPRASLFSMLLVIVSASVFSFLFFVGPEAYHYSLSKLLWGWLDSDARPLYAIEVTPGNARVGKRADLQIGAVLKGFSSQNVRIAARYENSPRWEYTAMHPDSGGHKFAFLFFDIRDRIDYYVEAEGIRSDQYTIAVADIPRVETFQIVLHFPRYTGMKSSVLDNQGDIRALAGTTAEFTIKTDQPVQGGKIKLESGSEITLKPAGPRELKGTLQVKEDDYYRIHLRDQENFWNPASDEYVIVVLKDQPPILSFTRPGRDQRVTNVEEVFTELKVEDDYGISTLGMRFSVNGGPEQQVKLDYARGSRSFSSSHTFYLEEFHLEPGDFVSYYAEAKDAVSSAVTDIYFFEVEPYDREYYQSQQGGGMPGGGAGGDNMMLSKRQKEIIAASFKLDHEKENYTSTEFQENSQTLALVQQRLQVEAQTIVERLQRRGAAAGDPRLRKMMEHLGTAITHMDPAHRNLNESKPKEALPEEQKAYQQLLRAEALFKEVQVAFAQSMAGAAGSSSAQDLANLVDLELDKKKNQYETLQQNRELNREQALDEALEKLKELARRQEQMAERRRRQAMQSAGGGANASQDELIEEVERLARELERLSRQQRDQELADISRELRQAARDMRQSQSGSQNAQQAQMRAQRALERLKQAQNALGQQRQNQLASGMEKLKQDSQALVKRQKEVVDQIGELQKQQQAGKVDQNFLKELRNLLREKSGLQDDVHELEGELHQTARQMASEQPEAARKLKQAGIDVRDQRIPEKMQEGSDMLSRGWTDLARQREEGVSEDLQGIADKIQQAEQALGPGNQGKPEERLQRALNQIGPLVENLESLRDRASDRSQASRGDQQGQSPEQGREQEGRQQGRQGQQGNQQGQRENQRGRQQNQPGQQRGQQNSQRPGEGSDSTQSTQSGQPNQSGGPRTSNTQAGTMNNTTGINPRQIAREWQERVQEAERMRPLFENNPELAKDLSALLREMRRLDAERLLSDPQERARLKGQVIDGFRQLELEINRALQQQNANLLRLVNQDEVPAEFRARVEEYYRTLSSKKKP